MLGCCRRLSGWAEPLPAAASPARPGCKLLPPGALLQTHKIDGWHTAHPLAGGGCAAGAAGQQQGLLQLSERRPGSGQQAAGAELRALLA